MKQMLILLAYGRAGALLYFAGLCISFPAAGQNLSLDSKWMGFDGYVRSVVQVGNTLYAGGEFSTVGINAGNIAGLKKTTAAANTDFPKTNGTVNCVAEDGNGGWFIGGFFNKVGNATRISIARINGDGTIHSWNASLSAVGGVNAICVSGNTVYLSGTFSNVGGQTHYYLAAVDKNTGAVTSWNPTGVSFPTIYSMAAMNGTIYIGGSFNSINGITRSNFASIDSATGNINSWAPNPNGAVNALVINGNQLYIGGNFTNIAGSTRNRLASFNLATSLINAWAPSVNGEVTTFDVDETAVYLGGYFSSIGGQARPVIGAVDKITATLLSWNPQADNSVYKIRVNNGSVYASGTFSSIGGANRNGSAALDITTGQATSWNPATSTLGTVQFGFNDSTVFLGGSFSLINCMSRSRLAAFDATTGQLLSWNPGCDGTVNVLAANGNILYAGGTFFNVAGQSRVSVCAFDASNGSLSSWNASIPGLNTSVWSIIPNGTVVYIAGKFSTIGGQTRNNLAALSASTAVATSWNPNVSHSTNPSSAIVYTLALSGNTLYVGGLFNSAGGQSRSNLAAIDLTSATASSWNPNPNNYVFKLDLTANTLYATGRFGTIGGQSRNNIAAIDLSAGLATSWNPAAQGGGVDCVKIDGSIVFIGGSFSTIGGQLRNGLAAVDITTAMATSWNQNFASGSDPFFIYKSGNNLFTGGDFQTIGGLLYSRFAGFGLPKPAISTFTPASGTSGTTITITGSNFSDVTAVSFGNVPASSFTIVNATTITAVVASGATGNVSLTNSGGTSSLAGFTYVAPSVINSFNPVNGCLGTSVVITGTNFVDVSNVLFGNTPAASFIVNSPTMITAVLGEGTTGPIRITTPAGTTASANSFAAGSSVKLYHYITNAGSNSVSVVDPSLNSVVSTIPVGNAPFAVCTSPDGSRVYVGSVGNGNISVINTATNSVIATIPLSISAMCISPDGQKIYATGSNSVYVIDAIHFSYVSIAVGDGPVGIAISPDGQQVYTANTQSNSVSVISTITNSLTTTVTVGATPYHVTVNHDGSKIYVCNSSDHSVSVINATGLVVTATIPVDYGPYFSTINSDGSKLYVSNLNSGTINVVNTALNVVTATFANIYFPLASALSPDELHLYVVCQDGYERVINTVTGSVEATILTGNGSQAFGSFAATVAAPCTITVNLKCFLQGYYAGAGTMQPVLLNQGASSSSTEVDNVTVELRDPSNFTLVNSAESMLSVDGNLSVTFTQNPGQYYIAVKHRNSIQTWSANPVSCSESTALYDFSSAAAKAYGDNMVEVEPGVWAFFTGDINQDENIDITDYPQLDVDISNFEFGYFSTDLNGDGNVDITDYPLLDANIQNFVYSVHP